MAGFVLSSLFNAPTQAQDEKKAVFDKVVCKELEIVSDEGQTHAVLSSGVFGGTLNLYKTRLLKSELDPFGMTLYTFDVTQKVTPAARLQHEGLLINNADGKEVAYIGSVGGKNGIIGILNADGKALVSIIGSNGKVGAMSIYNAEGKHLVHIGAIEGRPNDGLINIFNHKGGWRSYKGD